MKMTTYVPSRRPIIRFCSIMIALPMPSHIQYLVLHHPATFPVEPPHEMLEALPLRLFSLGIIFAVGVIGPIDQAEIVLCLFIDFPSVSSFSSYLIS
jgi:hypothetical protein